MKIIVTTLILCLATGSAVLAQSNESVTSLVVNNILLGNYNPSSYQATTVITDPNTISQGLLQNISADSLTADLYALNSFQNRNTFSDTGAATFGIGAARRWVYDKFVQYSQATGSRLQTGYLKFTYDPPRPAVPKVPPSPPTMTCLPSFPVARPPTNRFSSLKRILIAVTATTATFPAAHRASATTPPAPP